MQHEADHRLPPETAESRGGEEERTVSLKLGFHSENLDPGSAGSHAQALGGPFIGSVTLVTYWLLMAYLSQHANKIRMRCNGLL